MKIVTWNVNGLKSSFNNNISEYFKIINANIFCLQETKTTLPQVMQEIGKLNEYFFFISPCNNKSGYAGVGILSKLQPDKVTTSINFPEFDNDGRFLQLEFKDFVIINVYMPLGAKDLAHYDYKIEAYKRIIEHIKNIKDKPVIFCGDFNIATDERDLFDATKFINQVPFTDAERQIIKELENIDLVDSVRVIDQSPGIFTWWSYFQNDRIINKGMRIDYVFVSEILKSKIKSFKVHKEIFISDHAPLEVSLDFDSISEIKNVESGNVFGGLF